MGQIKSIVYKSLVPRPAYNSEFSIKMLGRKVRITYRNISIQLDAGCFIECVRNLQVLNRPLVEGYQYGRDAFIEAVCFMGVRAAFPGEGKFTLSQQRANTYEFKYRCLRILVSEPEGSALAREIILPKENWRAKFQNWIKEFYPADQQLDNPMLKSRFSVDLCENIHIHFQNLRFEFSKSEFLVLWDAVSKLADYKWPRFGFRTLCQCALPSITEWDDRFQFEEQCEGHFHIHYRNLRIEFRNFNEIGLVLKNGASYSIDQQYAARYIDRHGWKLAGIRSERLGNLKALVFTESGLVVKPLTDSPIFKALTENSRAVYDAYTEVVKRHDPACQNTWLRFQDLMTSVQHEGFRPQSLIVTKGDGWEIVDGQHRACILLFLYGPDLSAKIAHYE